MDKSIKIIIWVLFFSIKVYAENSYLPMFCDAKNLFIDVQNLGLEDEPLWIQIPIENHIDESFFFLSRLSTQTIKWSQYYEKSMSARIKTMSKQIKLTARCKDSRGDSSDLIFPLNSSTDSSVTYKISNLDQLQSLELHLLNLFPGPQKINISEITETGVVQKTHVVSLEQYYETRDVILKKSPGVSYLLIQSEARVHTLLVQTDSGRRTWIPELLKTTPTPNVDVSKHYFLIAPKNRSGTSQKESYIIGVPQGPVVEKFLEQIRHPELEKIIFATAVLDKNSYNRNFLSKDASPYSWTISDVVSFGDFGPIDCDGSPELFEELLMEKVNQGMYLCFWKYRAIKELSPEEVRRGFKNP